jgi:hypothetical protein
MLKTKIEARVANLAQTPAFIVDLNSIVLNRFGIGTWIDITTSWRFDERRLRKRNNLWTLHTTEGEHNV